MATIPKKMLVIYNVHFGNRHGNPSGARESLLVFMAARNAIGREMLGKVCCAVRNVNRQKRNVSCAGGNGHGGSVHHVPCKGFRRTCSVT